MLMPAEALSLRGLPFLRRGERGVTQHHGGLSLWNSQEDERAVGNGVPTAVQYYFVQCCGPPDTALCAPEGGPCTV